MTTTTAPTSPEVKFMADKLIHPELPHVTVQFIYVTPAKAEEWLTLNDRNRNMRVAHSDGIARDMEALKFYFNGDTIKFAYDGTLLDGQHRLRAIKVSGKAQWMLVVFGLGYDTQKVMDRNVVRQFADDLKMAGEANWTLLAAVVRKAMLWEQEAYLFSGGNVKLTRNELDTYLTNHKELRDSVRLAATHGKKIEATGSVIALAHWLFSHINPEQADWFILRLADRAGLEARHPILTLHDRLSKVSQPKAQKYVRFNDGEQMYLLITAWNLFRAGKKASILKFPIDGLTTQNMPMPQ